MVFSPLLGGYLASRDPKLPYLASAVLGACLCNRFSRFGYKKSLCTKNTCSRYSNKPVVWCGTHSFRAAVGVKISQSNAVRNHQTCENPLFRTRIKLPDFPTSGFWTFSSTFVSDVCTHCRVARDVLCGVWDNAWIVIVASFVPWKNSTW